VHINLLTQLTIKKMILNMKLKHRPMASRGHRKKSPNSGHASDMSKSLIMVTTMILLKIASNETSFITLKSTIRADLNLIDPLTGNRTNMGRKRNELPGTSSLKCSNVLNHSKLSFTMNNNLTISSQLRDSHYTIASRIIEIRRRMRSSTKRTSWLRWCTRSRGCIT
jgi:hypothetical protein